MNELKSETSCSQVRPWLRYWARSIDITLFAIFFMIIWLVTLSSMDVTIDYLDEVPDIVLGIVISFIYIFFEAFLLSTWGTTIGKSLFKIRVRSRLGNKLTYSEGLKRSFLVFFLGQGMGLPIVTIITGYVAYSKLIDNGITSWDEDGENVVTHQNLGKLRATLFIAIPIIIIILIIIGLSE